MFPFRNNRSRQAGADGAGRATAGAGSGKGFTLIELIVTIVLAGIVLSAIVMTLHPLSESTGLMKQGRDATLLAEDLMSEIRSRKFEDPETPLAFGPEAGESARAGYDDVDDYDGLSNAPPVTVEGAPLPKYADYTVTVAVENVLTDNFNAGTPAPDGSTDFKRIRVVVRKGRADLVTTNISVVSRYD